MIDLVGFCGRARSGKDTCADLLSDILVAEKLSLARPLKEAIRLITGWHEYHTDSVYKDHVYGPSRSAKFWREAKSRIGSKFYAEWVMHYDIHTIAGLSTAVIQDLTARWLDDLQAEFQTTGVSPRVVMQRFGTELGRKLNPQLWIEVLKRKRAKAKLEGTPLVLVPDVRFPNEADALHGWGGIVVLVERSDDESCIKSSHSSETEISKIQPDLIVTNDQDLQALSSKMRDLADVIRRSQI